MITDRLPTRIRRRDLLRQASVLVAAGCLAPSSLPRHLRAAEAERPREWLDQRTRSAIERGLAYLASRQAADGAFGPSELGRNVAVGALAGMAFLAAGHAPQRGKYGERVTRCVESLVDHAEENGFICAREAPSRGPMYGHGFATLFLAEVYGMSRNRLVRDKLANAVRLIVDTQNQEGGWRYEPRRYEADISVTVCQVMALRAARNAGIYVPNETIDRSIDYVKRCQNSDGGFMYQAGQAKESLFPRSAAALVALYSAGIYKGEEVRKGLDYLVRFPPRSNARGDQQYFFYGHYYAAQAMWHAGGKYWEAWYPAIREVLLEQQNKEDGSWCDRLDTANPDYGTAMSVLILQMPSNYLPIFQR